MERVHLMRNLIFITMLLLCSIAYVASVGNAQLKLDLETAQLKLLVGESGWDNELDQTVILFAVHRLDKQDARTENLLETLELHIPWWSNGAPPRRPWIARLDAACLEPEGFPKRLSWQRHQRWCFETVRRIRHYAQGRLKNPCKGTPNNWRARGKPSRKAKRLYYQVGCGKASKHNWFDTYKDPRGRVRKRMKHGKNRT